MRLKPPRVIVPLVVMALVISVVGYAVERTSRATALTGDINNDGVVNVFDLSILLSDWGTTTAAADLNNDHTVNILDLSVLLSNWGNTAAGSPTPTPTPTPSTTTWNCTNNVPVKENGVWNYQDATDANGKIVDSSCQYPQDAVHFTGQDDTSNLTNEVDQNAWGADCADANGNIVDTDSASCVNPETQEIQANSAQNFVITNKSPAGHTGVTAYTGVWAHGYKGVVDNYKTLTSTYNLQMPINANTSAWAMQDDWLSEPNSPNSWGDLEVMIQYDFTNNGECPSSWNNGANAWGVVANNVMIDGQAWHVCDGEEPMNADGTCIQSYDDSCGAVVFKLGATEAARPALTATSGTLDLKAIFQWLENNNVPGKNYPYIPKGSSISQGLSNGWEICTTGGVAEKFYGNGFTVNATH